MSSFEETITKACRENDIPGAVLVAGSKSGKLHYAKSFGVRSVATPSPLELDATMWIASCTKLVTTVACMQCIEKGLLSLDADVTTILPELKDVPILTGFDEENSGKPILIKNTKPITLRHLLTHSSGLAYDIFNPTLMRYLKYIGAKNPKIGEPDDRRIKEKYVFPLLFAPGEGWEYSVGLDWAGQMVERVNSNITLEEYFQKNIWTPLGIQDFTFRPQNNKAVQDRLAEIAWRHGGVNEFGSTDNPKGKMEATNDKFWDPTTLDCYGGAGLYGSMPQYHKLLQDIISNTPKILKPSSIDEMFTPQLTKSSMVGMKNVRAIEELNNGFGALDMDVEANWGLGGIMNMADMKNGRKKGSIAWGGYPNLMWWADRTSGVAGIYGSQICPPGDPLTVQLNGLWEKEIYDELNGTNAKL